MIEQIEHIKKFALQGNSALTVKQFGEAIARMCDDAIREAVEQSVHPTPPTARSFSATCPKCGTFIGVDFAKTAGG